ncbi:MAG: diguanylate cyclase, partial [Pseudomonadota bacterium]
MIVAIFSSVLIYLHETYENKQRIEQMQKREIGLAMAQLQSSLYNRLTEGDEGEALLSLSLAAMRPEMSALILADDRHRVMLANRYSWKGEAAAKHSRYSEVTALRVAQSGVSELAYSQKKDSLLQGYYPLVVAYQRGGLQKNMGVLYVEADSTPLLRGVHKETLENSLGYAAITLLAAAFIALLLHRLVCRRVNALNEATERIAAGDYSVRSNLQGNDELAELGKSFNLMARSVAENIQLREKATHDQKRVLETMVDGYWLLDGEGYLREVNEAYVRMSGYRREELLNMCIPDLEAKEVTLASVRAHMDAIIARGSERFETIHRRKDGSLFDVEISAHYWQDTGQFFGFIRDISERKAREESLRIAAVAFNTQEAIIVTDKFANIIRVNRAFETITGFSETEVLGKNPRILSSGLHNAEFYRQMWDAINTSGRWSGEVWDRRKDGAIYPKWLTITAVHHLGEVTHYVAVFVDITERKKAEEEIKNLAFFAPLTHMPNRRMLLDRLRLAMGQSARNKNQGALMFLDIDHFKVLNDTKGHEFGDKLLVEVARRLSACLRDIDSVARFGGDEFVVLLEGLSPHSQESAVQAGHIAEKIREVLAQPYYLENMVYQSSSSIGVVLFSGDEVQIDELLKQADLAMYQAKASGRNMVRFFEPTMQAVLESRTIMENALRLALSNGELELHYQLQTNSARDLLGAEVLLRWNSAELGAVSPVLFIPVAEQSRLILPIGHWVLETACKQLKIWEKHPVLGLLHLAVNVSPVQFHQEDFVDQVKAVLAATGANPRRLELELTENLVLEDINEATRRMVELRAIGVRFSMDDFGTGHSSLQY